MVKVETNGRALFYDSEHVARKDVQKEPRGIGQNSRAPSSRHEGPEQRPDDGPSLIDKE
jgi:hypothetical protein